MSNDAEKGFYFVWNPMGRAPSFRHATYDAALGEAKRLARDNAGQEFIILGAMTRCVVETLRVVNLDTSSLEIPF